MHYSILNYAHVNDIEEGSIFTDYIPDSKNRILQNSCK